MIYELIKEDSVDIGTGLILYRVYYPDTDELGGYIESEKNLEPNSLAKVYENARVSGNALITGGAQVFGRAYVGGNSLVTGNSKVYGEARIFENAKIGCSSQVYGNATIKGDANICGVAHVTGNAVVNGGDWKTSPIYIQGSRWAVTNCKPGHIQIDCLCMPFKDWTDKYMALQLEHECNDAVREEYLNYVKLIIANGV